MTTGTPSTPLSPTIDWWGDVPRSQDFDDVYFSSSDGLGEARHVFLDGIGGPSIWHNQARFRVAELGFGTGLNFLALWDLWRRTSAPNARLHVVSVEGFPLALTDLVRAQARFPELASLANELQAGYPRPVPGFHRRRFENGRVVLTLLFGPVEAMLASLSGSFDAWFLDGFAPPKNPEMWVPGVLQEVARLSAADARLATFSCAGAVRRGLAEAGYQVEKRPGFGAKRECLSGAFGGVQKTNKPNTNIAPWYRRPEAVMPGAHVAVIGAGIAGRAASAALVAEGFRVTVIDGGDRAGSDFPEQVLIAPRLADPADPYGRFMAQAFSHALAVLDSGKRADKQPIAPGTLHLPKDSAALGQQLNFLTKLGWGTDLARQVNSDEASDIAGLMLSRAGIHFPNAFMADPRHCLPMAALGLVNIIEGRVQTLIQDGGGWHVDIGDRAIDADAIVLAAGPWSRTLLPASDLPLNAKRGQLSHLPVTAASRALRLPISFGGYLTPTYDWPNGQGHTLGASYELWDVEEGVDWQTLQAQDQEQTLEKLADFLPDLASAWRRAPIAGWAGLRATTPDHLPVVGPVPDATAYCHAYADLHHGRRGPHAPAPYLANAFVLSGLGSRGYQTAYLAAEVLVAQMTGAPMPVPADVGDTLHPGRMLIRRLRRPPALRELMA